MPEQRAVRACDAEIKAKLRAPSTYKRLDYSASRANIYGAQRIFVEYEAQNAMGVPLRGEDSCIIPD